MIGPCSVQEAKQHWRWDNFTPQEFACSCCGVVQVDEGFMDKLQALRTATSVPMPISSGFRCPDYNDHISSTGREGPHTTGHACDISLAGESAFVVLTMAEDFKGIGLKQHGPWKGRFIHLDDLENGEHPRPRIWTYK